MPPTLSSRPAVKDHDRLSLDDVHPAPPAGTPAPRLEREPSDRRQSDRDLRQSEERFKFVARAVSDVVWDWDLTTDTLWWNDGYLTTFGFIAGEIEPAVAAWTGRIHPDERQRVLDGIQHALAHGAELWEAEYRVARKDGTYAFVQDRGLIIRDAAGRATRMVGGMRDLTAHKQLEAQSLRAQRMESIGTLAGGIAHDLNNVLTPIMLSIELLRDETDNDPRRHKILDSIYANSRRGADLVRQVLSFARGVDGRRTAVRLRSLLQELEGIISPTFPRNIRIVTEIAPTLWPVTADPSQLHQVLLNLVVNARDAMPSGGTLTLKAANVTIDAQFAGMSQDARPGGYILLQVTDTGVGIPPALRERIFDPYFTTKRPGHGTGIGLATVHTIVRNHGGFLNVESEIDLGTTFRIYLPADPALRNPSTVSPFTATLPRGRGELILVADDEPTIRDITRQTLEASGYRVLTAEDGAEAVGLYAQQAAEIALVLTDIMMPIMDGAMTIQVLQRINPDIRIIAASGLDSGKYLAAATNAGVNDFLPKPYTTESLLTLVREVLDRAPDTRRPVPA